MSMVSLFFRTVRGISIVMNYIGMKGCHMRVPGGGGGFDAGHEESAEQVIHGASNGFCLVNGLSSFTGSVRGWIFFFSFLQ